jgi:hypothetical protein
MGITMLTANVIKKIPRINPISRSTAMDIKKAWLMSTAQYLLSQHG